MELREGLMGLVAGNGGEADTPSRLKRAGRAALERAAAELWPQASDAGTGRPQPIW